MSNLLISLIVFIWNSSIWSHFPGNFESQVFRMYNIHIIDVFDFQILNYIPFTKTPFLILFYNHWLIGEFFLKVYVLWWRFFLHFFVFLFVFCTILLFYFLNFELLNNFSVTIIVQFVLWNPLILTFLLGKRCWLVSFTVPH